MKVLKDNLLDVIVNDIIKNSRNKPKIKMSKRVETAMNGLYDFMYKNVYTNPAAKKEEKKVESGEIKIYKEERNPIGFSKSIKDAVKMVTFSEKTNPVGSYKYRVHAYPSDIDIFEKIEECCDVKTATQNVTKRLKQIARNIKNNKKVYLGDFKAGIDDDLIIDCGEISYTKPISFSGYKRQTVVDKLTEFTALKVP